MARFALLLGLGLLVAGCGSEGPSGQGAASESIASTQTSTGEPAETGSPDQMSRNGRFFGYVRGAKPTSLIIIFDIAQAFSGEAANRAAAEDGIVEAGEAVPNDHYERNEEQDVELVKLASDASVTAAWPASFLMQYVSRGAHRKCERSASAVPCTQVPLSLDAFFAATGELPPDFGIPVWLRIRNGVVEQIDEQYFP